MKTNNPDYSRKGKGVLLIIFGLIYLGAHIGTLKFQYSWGNINRKDLIKITGVASEKPKINYGRNTEIVIKLKNHSEILFENSQIFYSATKAETFIKEYQTGDSLSLFVWEYDYKSKVIKSESRNFFERFALPGDQVSFYGLTYKGKEYVDLDEINAEFYLKSFLKYLNWVLCFGIIGYGIYLIRSKGR